MTLNSYELAAEMRDAAEHNFQAGNHQTAGTQALIAMMRLQFANAEPVVMDVKVTLPKPAPASNPLPTEQGVYKSAMGIFWFRSGIDTSHPWLDITRAHSEDRWFTEAEAAKHAPFTRMEAAA